MQSRLDASEGEFGKRTWPNKQKCPFGLDEAAALFLHLEDQFEGISNGVNPMVLARSLAVAISFRGEHFSSLAQRFRVSPSAMALRLVEIGLVER